MMNWWKRFLAAWRMQASFDPILLERVRQLIQEANTVEGSGEYKRHRVYARLIKEFPSTSRQHLALAIEVALCFG